LANGFKFVTVSELLAMNKGGARPEGGERPEVANHPDVSPSPQHHVTPPVAPSLPATSPNEGN